MWIAKERAEADLVAVRVVLEKLDNWLLDRPVGIHWASNPLHDEVVVTLSRLGTGEALAAVREAQQYLNERATRESSGQAAHAFDRLRAAFGGEV